MLQYKYVEHCELCHTKKDLKPRPRGGVYCDFCAGCLAKLDAQSAAECEKKRLAEYERHKLQRETRKLAYQDGSLPAKFGMLFRHDLARRDGSICGICGDHLLDPMKAHVDHIVPISHGGEHEWHNVRLTHPVCNLRKGNRS